MTRTKIPPLIDQWHYYRDTRISFFFCFLLSFFVLFSFFLSFFLSVTGRFKKLLYFVCSSFLRVFLSKYCTFMPASLDEERTVCQVLTVQSKVSNSLVCLLFPSVPLVGSNLWSGTGTDLYIKHSFSLGFNLKTKIIFPRLPACTLKDAL